MIGRVRGDDAALAGHGLGHSQGNVVGLGPRTRQDRSIKGRGHRRGKAVNVVQNAIMQIACMSVQRAGLAANRFNDTGVTVSDMGHIIVAIQIFTPRSVPQPNTIAFHEMDGVVVKRGNVRTHKPGPVGDQLRCGAAHNSILIPS